VTAPFRWFISFVLSLAVLFVVVLACGCAAAGFYQMTDDWCQAHQKASATRCDGR
jgi:hypothetical protein